MARHRYKKQPPPRSEAAAGGGYKGVGVKRDDFGNPLKPGDPEEFVRAEQGNPRLLFGHKVGGKGNVDPSAYRKKRSKQPI